MFLCANFTCQAAGVVVALYGIGCLWNISVCVFICKILCSCVCMFVFAAGSASLRLRMFVRAFVIQNKRLKQRACHLKVEYMYICCFLINFR